MSSAAPVLAASFMWRACVDGLVVTMTEASGRRLAFTKATITSDTGTFDPALMVLSGVLQNFTGISPVLGPQHWKVASPAKTGSRQRKAPQHHAASATRAPDGHRSSSAVSLSETGVAAELPREIN